jgi:hypothetical protein
MHMAMGINRLYSRGSSWLLTVCSQEAGTALVPFAQ